MALISLAILFWFSLLRYSHVAIGYYFGYTLYLWMEGLILVGFLLYFRFGIWKQSGTRENLRLAAPPVAGPAAQHQSDPLLSLRFLACLLVLTGHSVLVDFPPGHLMDDIHDDCWYSYLLPEPWAGIWIFFILSGYLMGKGFFSGRYDKNVSSCISFYRNRCLRIVPLYAFATLLIGALVLPTLFYPINFMRWVTLFVFFDFGPKPVPISALWSVGTEMEFYLMVPFIFVLFGNFFTKNSLFCFATVSFAGFINRMIMQSYLPHMEITFGGPAWGNMDLFLSGFILNALVRRYRDQFKFQHGLALALVILAGYYLIAAWFCRDGRLLLEELPYWGLLVILPTLSIGVVSTVIFLMETSPMPSGGFLIGRLIRWTQFPGLLTYSLYVWHEPIYIAASRDLQNATDVSLSLSSALGIMALNIIKVTLIAIPSYYLIELYFERKKAVVVHGLSPGHVGAHHDEKEEKWEKATGGFLKKLFDPLETPKKKSKE